jgi:UDP-2,3-diacylglucosamine pyrophosphatase LpxH
MGPVVRDITTRILLRNKDALAYLRDLNGKITVSDGSGKSFDIPLYIHYFVGNHDWFYHLPGPDYVAARKEVIAAFGLSNDSASPFPHQLAEASPELFKLIRAHRLHPQHGDLYDEMNFEARRGRDYSSLGDCIVVELLNRFPIQVKHALALKDDDPDFASLREIDNVRPLLAVPSFIQGVLRRSKLERPQKEQVMKVWDNLAETFIDHPFVRSLDVWGFDKVDKLELALRFSSGLPLRALSALSDKLNLVAWAESYAQSALKEDALLRGEAEFVAYGHTHHPETVSLDLAEFGAEVREQVYFNTGTWRRVHQRCVRQPHSFEFGSFHVMTYVTLYVGTERGGRRYETWTGQLA